MLRVGYPATLSADLLRDFPEGIELIPVSDKMDHDVEIDVWIPDPYSTRAMRAWPRLRGVKLVLSMMAGTEWIPGTVGPHVTICNAHGAHNISTAEWTLAAILAMLKYFPLYLDIQTVGRVEAAVRGQRALRGDHRRHAPDVSAGDAGRADGQDGAAGGVRRDRQGDRAHARAVRCEDVARGAQGAHRTRGARRRANWTLCCRARRSWC